MSDLEGFNRAGAIFSGLIGVALIAISGPFTVTLWDSAPTLETDTFNIGWDPAPVGDTTTLSLSAVGNDNGEVTLTDVIVMGVRLDISCSDDPGPGGNPATFTVTVAQGNEEVDRVSGTCSEVQGTVDLEVFPTPNMTEAQGANVADARDRVYEETADSNQTATFEVTLQIVRPAVGGLVTSPTATVSGTVEATGLAWHATPVEPAPEVVR